MSNAGPASKYKSRSYIRNDIPSLEGTCQRIPALAEAVYRNDYKGFKDLLQADQRERQENWKGFRFSRINALMVAIAQSKERFVNCLLNPVILGIDTVPEACLKAQLGQLSYAGKNVIQIACASPNSSILEKVTIQAKKYFSKAQLSSEKYNYYYISASRGYYEHLPILFKHFGFVGLSDETEHLIYPENLKDEHSSLNDFPRQISMQWVHRDAIQYVNVLIKLKSFQKPKVFSNALYEAEEMGFIDQSGIAMQTIAEALIQHKYKVKCIKRNGNEQFDSISFVNKSLIFFFLKKQGVMDFKQWPKLINSTKFTFDEELDITEFALKTRLGRSCSNSFLLHWLENKLPSQYIQSRIFRTSKKNNITLIMVLLQMILNGQIAKVTQSSLIRIILEAPMNILTKQSKALKYLLLAHLVAKEQISTIQAQDYSSLEQLALEPSNCCKQLTELASKLSPNVAFMGIDNNMISIDSMRSVYSLIEKCEKYERLLLNYSRLSLNSVDDNAMHLSTQVVTKENGLKRRKSSNF